MTQSTFTALLCVGIKSCKLERYFVDMEGRNHGGLTERGAEERGRRSCSPVLNEARTRGCGIHRIALTRWQIVACSCEFRLGGGGVRKTVIEWRK